MGAVLGYFHGYFLNRICFLHESAFLPHETSESESKVSQDSSGRGPKFMQRDSCHGCR